jgi:NAD(P)-dependent dehydrogenase (short-subunit alcohol dehydrogenase family)
MAGKRVIVTGGFGALGGAVGRAFQTAGDQVALVDLAQPPQGAPGSVLIGGADLADAAGAQRAFDAARQGLGGADVLVNAAGAFRFETVAGDVSAWPLLYRINLLTALNMCHAAIGGLSGGGAIVNIGAAAADRAAAGMGPYTASKASVARLTETLAAELKGRIRVNAVLPLTMDTPQNRADMPNADPAGWTSTAAVADVILFLASQGARAINGALIPVVNPAA